ncbi:MAG: sodium:solute symporter [Phycisphaerales bacterium]
MHTIDWTIVVLLLTVLAAAAVRTRRTARSVTGFLAAERCGGRYLITVANNAAMVGVISLVWFFEQNHDVGFTTYWWQLMEGPALVLMALSGWVYYRYRQTRALTLAEFFEMRYGRRFRVFAGLVAFSAGIVNFGIFPSVGSRFFMAMWGLPETWSLAGFAIGTYPTLMIGLLAISLALVLLGGQVAVMVTDFIQGSIGAITFVVVIAWLMLTIGWDRMEWMLRQPESVTLVHPFRLETEARFDVWYYVIGVVVLFYGPLGWQGTAGYNTCAIDAHEAKMANILNGWRPRVLLLVALVVPLCVRTINVHPDFAPERTEIAERLEASVQAGVNRANEMGAAADVVEDQLRTQLRVPSALPTMLPPILMGFMSAAMLGAFISTHDTYLHSWGGMFVQDVVLPFRRTPLSPERHVRLLRFGIAGVAVFIFLFSLWVRPTQYVSMFLALTGAIFVGGAGSAIIGGLYWRRGSPAAAWTAMIVGITVSSTGVVLKQVAPIEGEAEGFAGFLRSTARWLQQDLTGQELTFGAIALSIGAYVAVSILGPRHDHDMDALLHRGEHAPDGADDASDRGHAPPVATWRRRLGMNHEFTRADVFSTLVTVAYPVVWTVIFVLGSAYNLSRDVPVDGWIMFWRIWLIVTWLAGAVVSIWFVIGGFRNLGALRRGLADAAAAADRADDPS